MNQTVPEVRTIEEFFDQPEEYREAVRKVVRSHSVNELYGAQVSPPPLTPNGSPAG